MTEDDRFTWDAAKITAVRLIALDGGTARQACEAVGLDPEREHLIYRLAKSKGYRFKNIGRKRDDRSICIRLEDLPSTILTDRARQISLPRRDLAAKLLNIVLQQGQTFIDNLLDPDA
jgi:hypothetical protein